LCHCCGQVLDVTAFEGQGAFSVQSSEGGIKGESKEAGIDATPNLPKKSKTPQSNPSSVSTPPEAFLIGTPGQEVDVVSIKEGDEKECTNTPQPTSTSNTNERKRKISTPDVKKQLMTLNSRRQKMERKTNTSDSNAPGHNHNHKHHASPSTNTSDSETRLPPDFYSPLKSANTTSPVRKTPLPPGMVMMSFENCLPVPNSPITAPCTRVETMEVYEPEECSGSPPRNTLSGAVTSEEQEEEIQLSRSPSISSSRELNTSPRRAGSMRRCPSVPDSGLHPPGPSHFPPSGSPDALAATLAKSLGFKHAFSSSSTPKNRDSADVSQSLERSEQWIQAATSHDSPLPHGTTVFGFADDATRQFSNGSWDLQHDERSSETSADSFSFDRDEAVGENNGSGNDGTAWTENHCLGRSSGSGSDRDGTSSYAGPIRSSSPVRRTWSSQEDSSTLYVNRLKDHFNDLKVEFVEEYGEDAIRLLSFDRPASSHK
jgi:hypothetical protein